MNKRFKTLRLFTYTFIASVAFAACSKEEPAPTPTPDPTTKTEEPTKPSTEGGTTNGGSTKQNIVTIAADAPAPGSTVNIPVVSTEEVVDKFPGINKTNVSKIILRFYEGHIHKPASFHYVAGPKGFVSKSLSFEQDITLEWKNGDWAVTEGEKFLTGIRGVAYGTTKGGLFLNQVPPKGGNMPKEGEEIPAPVFGLWVEYYDAAGKLLNEGIATQGAFQTFFRPQQAKKISSGVAMTQLSTDDMLGYIYRDTNPFNKTAKELGQSAYVDQTDPVGLKGFFFFNQQNLRFALNLELWETPQGKLTNGERASFMEPSEHIKKTGRPVLSVSIPTFVFFSRAEMDNYEEDMALTDQTAEDQAIFKSLMKMLSLDWEKTVKDLVLRVDGDREGEEGGQWF